MLSKFLDALVEDGINNPDSLIIYTEDMAKEKVYNVLGYP